MAGDDGGVVRAARGAGAEVREGLRAGGGGLGRRGAAHAALRAAAARRARAVRRAGAAAAQHLPHLQPRQGQAPGLTDIMHASHTQLISFGIMT